MSTEIAEYSATEAALADLRTRFKDVAWDLTTTKGDKEARSARLELVTLRTGLEAERKRIKAPALAHCALIDAEAKRITDEIKALESPIDALIKADEKRRADEKAERERIERERVDAIKQRMAAIRAVPMEMVGKTSGAIREALEELSAMAVDAALFEEFELQAQGDRHDAVRALTRMLDAVAAQEAEAVRLQAERENLARQQEEQRQREVEAAAVRRQQEETDRLAREEADRKAAADRAAEQKRLDDQAAELRRREEELSAREAAAKPTPVEAVPQPVEETVVVAAPDPVAAPVNSGATIKLGYINDLIAPLSISADGLAQLGFQPVGTERAAKLYRESSLPAIRDALIQSLRGISFERAAA